MEGFGQISIRDSTESRTASDHIDRLKSGRLIIIFPDYYEKIKYLQKWSTDSLLSKRKIKRIQNSLDRTLAERDSFKARFNQAMNTSYRFSKWGYTWRSDITPSKENEYLPVFLDGGTAENLHIDQDIYFLQRGQTENGAESVVVCDHLLEPLEKPFPYFMRINSVTGIIESMFNPSALKWRDFESMLSEWDQRLARFWEKAGHTN